jgi:succinate dehydrogenase/fumarate reductase flavoprotein subunit
MTDRLSTTGRPPRHIRLGQFELPVTSANTVIVGAGASGMGCAVQLVRFWRRRGFGEAAKRVCVVTGGLRLGASRMSGSDKQTYYKLGTSPRVADTAEDFARTLTAFGCCHGDTALVEGVCSLRGFYNLVEVGVPFPHDPVGAFIGYKTDHDPYERATSAGPKTSRFMSECLQAEAERVGVTVLDHHVVGRLVTAGEGADRRVVAMVCFDTSRAGGDDPGLCLLVARHWVLAAGGPGELYRASVYPRGQFGIHGAAFLAGLEAVNLTESQYGLASTRFRWNVSGTYMQVVPRLYSTDAAGNDAREFLTDYFPDMPSMATAIFLKGYQWPFDAQRITGGGSSLIDMAVHQETVVRGRRVWMDFLRNPAGAPGWKGFRLDALGDEARAYLQKTGAEQAVPIERLRHMNTPAIQIYAENGIDLTAEPLEIALCAQHMNGGFAVDPWWQSNVPGVFVIGEMAGTHGVKRPGGSALNAGQVGALRAAEYIANVLSAEPADPAAAAADARADLERFAAELKHLRQRGAAAATSCEQAMDEIRQRMTRFGAHLRSRRGAREALDAAAAQYRRLLDDGLRLADASGLHEAATTLQQCLTHVALLKAVCGLLDRGAGSRGSHCVLDPDGIEMPPALIDPDTDRPYRFRPENEALRGVILRAAYNPGAADLFDLRDEPPRPIPQRDVAFESAWAEFREGRIFER